MFIFAAAVQGAATRYRGGETGGVGGRRRFAGPGPLAPGLQNQRSGGLPFGRPPPLCARFARPPPPPRAAEAPPTPTGRPPTPVPCPAAHGPSGPSALRGGGGGGRAAPLPGGGQRPPPGPFGGRRPPNAAAPPANARFQPPPNRKTDPVQGPVKHQAKGSIAPQASPGCRQGFMPPSFSCGTDPPPGR